MKIVVVEDEEALREEIVFYLQHTQHEVVGVGSAAALYQHLSVAAVDLILLDLGLPDEDGLGIAPHLREKGYGVVMLTARSTIEDHIVGLQQGADAYVTKPVDFGLLNATLLSVYRRLGEKTTTPALPAAWRLDSAQWTLYTPDGRTIPLTAKETTLLDLFFATPCVAVSRHTLSHAINPVTDDLEYRLEMVISRLRGKVYQSTSLTLPLKTIRGIGYALICIV